MKQTKRVLSGTVIVLIVLMAWIPTAMALDVSQTWESVLETYPGHEIQPLKMTLEETKGRLKWADIIAQQGADVIVKVFDSAGLQINTTTNDILPATGQNAAIILASDSRGANLYDVLIMGDVLGTGKLNIAQVTRMAKALVGTKPLEGIYLQAADINGSGSVDIGDLTTVVKWMRLL